MLQYQPGKHFRSVVEIYTVHMLMDIINDCTHFVSLGCFVQIYVSLHHCISYIKKCKFVAFVL